LQLVNDLAEKYAERFTSRQDDLLTRLHDETLKNHPHAHMLSSSVQGTFLSFLSVAMQPRYVLEIGTFTGYSALCLSEGLRGDGALHTIELRGADADVAEANFKISNAADRIFLHRGNAADVIPTLDYRWDMVFIDADKTSYIDYYELVLPRLSENGIIIADNVLFHGEVLGETITGKNARAIHEFNQHVANDPRTEQVLLTMRDGLMLIKKRK
jgi:caffeoyl-CoA O-methyltransferase